MNQIKEVLEDKGINQIWLAEKLGKSYNMLNSFTQNGQKPRLNILLKSSKFLTLTPKN